MLASNEQARPLLAEHTGNSSMLLLLWLEPPSPLTHLEQRQECVFCAAPQALLPGDVLQLMVEGLGAVLPAAGEGQQMIHIFSAGPKVHTNIKKAALLQP
jgi:hypothetical protein